MYRMYPFARANDQIIFVADSRNRAQNKFDFLDDDSENL